MRTYQHLIDTKAVKQVLNSIPDYCVIRELTERDYGIDLMIEFFSKIGENQHKHPIYDTTGHICYLQIKGTEKQLKINDDETISFSIDKKSLFYVEKFSTPFILVRVCTLKGKQEIYFLWLQRYISDKLDNQKPDWRTETQESETLYIPIDNKLPSNFEKVEKIAWRIKYIEEQAEFTERFTYLKLGLLSIINVKDDFSHFIEMLRELKRISHLSTLMNKNHCCIDTKCVQDLIDYLKEVRNGRADPEELEDFPHYHNFDLLLSSNTSTRSLEEMEAENEGGTTY